MRVFKKVALYAFFASVAFLFSCAGAETKHDSLKQERYYTPPQEEAKSAPQSSIINTNWLLRAIKVGDKSIFLERDMFDTDLKTAFSLMLGDGDLSGMAFPNKYSAHYSLNGDTIEIGQIYLTKMAALNEFNDIKEEDFFSYLSKMNRWELLPDGQLELYVENNGKRDFLIFEKE